VFDGPEIVDALCRKLRDPPHDDFRLIVLLPAKPDNGQDDTRGQLAVLTAADGHAARWLAVTVRSRHGDRTDPLDVDAKVPIVDDDGLSVGSADLNEHSLCNHTETCVTDDTQLATAARRRLWAEHLECDETELGGEPVAVSDERWRPIAQDQLERSPDRRPPPTG
jgi:phosphatidylserine/phosphatidylglycerophosphate/cardiolipin synthase-like enzyme